MDGLSFGGRSWYLTATGADLSSIQGDAMHHLAEVMDRHPGVGAFTLHTSTGDLNVVRDGPSSSSEVADRHMAAVFEHHPDIASISFMTPRGARVVTRDDPYISHDGKAYSDIAAASARGVIGQEEAIAQITALARQKGGTTE